MPADDLGLEPSGEERAALDEHGEAIFDQLHAEMRAQQDHRLQLVPAFLQIAALTVTVNGYLLTKKSSSAAVGLMVGAFSVVLIVGSWVTLHHSLRRYRERHRLLEDRLDLLRRHWGLHRLFDPEPLRAVRGPTADQWLIALVAVAVMVLLCLAAAAHIFAT